MASISALRTEVASAQSKVDTLCWMHSRQPDSAYHTGRIKGTDCRYSLRVWYRRNSGTADCLVTFHRHGQSDSVTGPWSLDMVGNEYRCDSEEGSAVHQMIVAAQSDHYRAEFTS